MTLAVRRLDAAGFDAWDGYLQRAPLATFFHRAGWKTVLERAFGHKTHFLYAERAGAIVGILPLAQIKSVLFGGFALLGMAAFSRLLRVSSFLFHAPLPIETAPDSGEDA